MHRTLLALCAAAMLTAGCADMSGLNASSQFACAAPEGSSCLSVSGVYANLEAGNLPGAGVTAGMARDVGRQGEHPRLASPAGVAAPYSGPPVRSPERTLRVWVAPYEDDTGTLFDQKYFYVLVSRGQWLIEKNREHLLRNRFRMVYPLQAPNGSEQVEAQSPATGSMPFMPPAGQGDPTPQSPVSMIGK
ncbi:TraV family lipoprotein [Cupriavidus basilensis]|uniref:Conjugative transfer protein TraV n=1 Tax=Cupriavidus basilensis TaxID=68895 RepID=A0A0C4YJW8_9BURK|nr:TraV family lipoprotein [Cupriavidus basilensis]AJG22229.1 Conjugative transfer protein TraV [Cupriavidus basilensis]